MAEIQKKRKHHDLRHRILVNGVSTILIAFFILFAEYRPLRWVFTAAVAAVSAIALWEYYQLLKKKALQPATMIGILGAILYVVALFLKTQGPYSNLDSLWFNLPIIILALTLFACFIFFALRYKAPLLNIAATFFGLIYVVVPLSLIINVMYFFKHSDGEQLHLQGSWWVIYLIAVTKSADMGGYFVGRNFGKRKLALRLSPNKTLEGAIAGLCVSTLLSLFLCYLGKKFGNVFEDFSYIQSIFLGFLIGLLGQMGDLAESLLKRDAKVKDSNAIPGVGGILDMVDSLLFTTPLMYIFLKIFYT